MACTMTEASYQRGCRCLNCTSAHRSYSQSRRYRGLPSENKQGRPVADKRKRNVTSTGRGAVWQNALTRHDIMIARGYTQQEKDKND
jgi:hypothetical protein